MQAEAGAGGLRTEARAFEHFCRIVLPRMLRARASARASADQRNCVQGQLRAECLDAINARWEILTPQQKSAHATLAQKEDEKIAAKQDTDDGLLVADEDFEDFAPQEQEYEPQRFLEGAHQHPTALIESAVMRTVPVPSLRDSRPLNIADPEWDIVKGGLLSLPQLETVALVKRRHESDVRNGVRGGFLLGDTTGVGKGRQLAGVILENWLSGTIDTTPGTRALWVSISKDLIGDAMRDFTALAKNNPSHVPDLATSTFDLSSCDPDAEIADSHAVGVGFATYSLLTGRAGSKRVDSIIKWLSSVAKGCTIVFDECHRAKNGASDSAIALNRIQSELPSARIVYASATGATEPRHMAYMVRLGLWGPGTAYRDFDEFRSSLERHGVVGMEACAMGMKAEGLCVCRQLSYLGVDVEPVKAEMTDDMEKKFDRAVQWWDSFLAELPSARAPPKDRVGDKDRSTMGEVWGVYQRFFRQLMVSSKVDELVRKVQAALATDLECVVIGLQSTGEAALTGVDSEGVGVDGVGSVSQCPTATLGFTLERLVDKAFQYDTSQRRNKFKTAIRALELPCNPLDDLIAKLGGGTNVAELTGRKARYESDGANGWKKERSAIPENTEEMRQFMDGSKLVAIISEAASTGISLHAERGAKNQRRRVHFTVELPWSADKAIQQFGRSHRSNQVSAPRYVFVLSEVAGEARFVSSVARRLASLGALLHGDAQDTSRAGQALKELDVENRYGLKALKELYDHVVGTAHLATEEKAWAEALVARGLGSTSPETGAYCAPTKTEVKQFLNRLCGMAVSTQRGLFDLFFTRYAGVVAAAKADNDYDIGVVDMFANNSTKHGIIKQADEGVGASAHVRHLTFLVDRGIPWGSIFEIIEKHGENSGTFYRSTSQTVFGCFNLCCAVRRSGDRDDRDGRFNVFRPHVGFVGAVDEYELHVNTVALEAQEAKQLWDQIYELAGTNNGGCVHGISCPHPVGCRQGCRRVEQHMLNGPGLLGILPLAHEAIAQNKDLNDKQRRSGLVRRITTTDDASTFVGLCFDSAALGCVLDAVKRGGGGGGGGARMAAKRRAPEAANAGIAGVGAGAGAARAERKRSRR